MKLHVFKEVNGIKIGFLGYRSMSVSMNNEQGRATIKAAIEDLKNNQGANAVVVFYHWELNVIIQLMMINVN